MSRLENLVLPRLETAPFYKPLSREEFGALVGQPPIPGDLEFAPGWDLAAYSIRAACGHRVSTLGWVRGPFAISDYGPDEDVVLGVLYHLPMGRLLGTFSSAEVAAFAAAVLEPAADWPSITIHDATALFIPVTKALREAGFAPFPLPTSEGMIPVWNRQIGGLH